MSEAYEFFEHTADIGAHAFGRTLEELFTNAARAMYEAMGTLVKAGSEKRRELKLEATTLEDLLHDWLAELLYEVEANRVLYDEFEIHHVDSRSMQATLHGGTIDYAQSQTNEEIKAITYHQLRVEQTTDGSWRATVILDV